MKPVENYYIEDYIRENDMSKPGFPIWWETTVTIYNKFLDPQTQLVTWYRHVVTDCFWQLSGTTVKVGDVTLDSKSIICRIPKDDAFLEKQEWIALPNDQMENYFTLAPGDIIVKGICEEVINEYARGHHSTDLLGKYRDYQACMEITDYSNNTGLGRNNEHYMTRGK
jgi:hypothetical protein